MQQFFETSIYTNLKRVNDVIFMDKDAVYFSQYGNTAGSGTYLAFSKYATIYGWLWIIQHFL